MKRKVIYIVVLVFSFFVISYVLFINCRYKNEVVLFQTKGKPIEGGIIYYGLIENTNFVKTILHFKFNKIKQLTKEQIVILDTITANSTFSFIGTCDIDACIVYFGNNCKVNKIILITCYGNQLEVNALGVFDLILLKEDQVNFINGLSN